ncbi:MAG: right-handed parallel beta-helix repeat-containing protein [Clostridia bacterium]|nr:right-handed parallel beta-helix repeat-containing protein [Clostridia bacterium]
MYSYDYFSTLYISQKLGDDGANGLAPASDSEGNGPLSSLERALELVSELRRSGVERPLTLSLVDDYYLTSPLTINEKLLTVESFGTQKRIIGGIRVEGWVRGEFNGVPCLCATLPQKEGGWDLTDLYVNGERAKVTRYPKTGRLKIAECEDPKAEGAMSIFDHSSTWFKLIPEDVAELGDLTGATINYFHYWVDEHSPIDHYDKESGKIYMKYRSRFTSSAVYDGKDAAAIHYYLTGVASAFGARGEWHFDKKSSTVYYIPENDDVTPESIEAFVPTLDSLIHVEGEDVKLRGLELTCTKGNYASSLLYASELEKYPERPLLFASDIQSVCGAPGAIIFENASRCSVDGCYIHGVGIHGIEIGKSCDHIRIEGNHICDICAGGIKIEGGTALDEPSQRTHDCVIRKNHIHAIGKRYLAGCGVFIMDASDCEIAENEIHDTEYSGISVGWVWGYADSATYGNIIRGNHIYDIGKGNLSDMGGIYLLGKQRGTVVAENRIHGIRRRTYGAWGIYLDEGSSYVTVERNAVYDTEAESLHLHYGSHDTVRNNIFYSEKAPCIAVTKPEEHYQVNFECNLLITKGEPIFFGKESSPEICFGRNLIWDMTRPCPQAKRDKLFNFFDFPLDLNSNVIADPKFPNIEGGDFTLAPDSPAFKLGFTPLPEKTAKG